MLFISLIVLVVMTIVGLAAMQGTALDERMAGNLRDRTLAFEAAEATLRDGAEVIDRFTEPGGSGLVLARRERGTAPSLEELDGSAAALAITELADVFKPGRFLIEEVAVVLPGGGVESAMAATREGAEYYYAITALGYGSTPQARVMLQSIQARRF